jgi:hypothetical protein
MCPWGSSLLLGNANGGIRRLQIGSDDPVDHKPKLVEVSGQHHATLAPGQHVTDVTCSSSAALRQVTPSTAICHAPACSVSAVDMRTPGHHSSNVRP